MTVALDETRAFSLGSGDVLVGLRRELEVLAGLDPAVWCDGESLVGLLGVVSRVESLAAAQSEAFRRSGEWITAGAQTAAAWVAVESHGDAREVRARLRRGRAVQRMELVSAAFAAGEISVDHVDRLARVRNADPNGVRSRRGDVGRLG